MPDGRDPCEDGHSFDQAEKTEAQASGGSKEDDAGNTDLIIEAGFPVLNGFRVGQNKTESDPLPRAPFASYRRALSVPDQQLPSLLRDCESAFTARTREDDAGYSTGCTYFVPCQMKPRCALEALALQIFRAHTEGVDVTLYDPERSGAEWWTLVLDASSLGDGSRPSHEFIPAAKESSEGTDEDGDEEEEEDEVGMHFDADYGLESQLPHYMIHPRVATVTYLSDVGSPTLILDKRSPAPADVTKASLNGNISKGWLSQPAFGKHVAFDGRLLHGAPGTFFPGVGSKDTVAREDVGDGPDAKRKKTGDGTDVASGGGNRKATKEKRVTFLVNVWLNHCPIDADLLGDDLCKRMVMPWEDDSQPKGKTETGTLKRDESNSSPFEWILGDVAKPEELTTLTLLPASAKEDSAGDETTVLCHRELTVSFGSTMEDLHAAAASGGGGKSLSLEFGKGSLCLTVGNEVESSDDEDTEDGT